MTDPIEAQLATVTATQAEVLGRYWARARELVPEAVAATYYAMPALKVGDRGLVSLMPTKRGYSVYPYGNRPVEEVLERHPGHAHTKGSVHFTDAAPLPIEVFDDLVLTSRRLIGERKKS